MDKMEELERLARAAKQDFIDFDMPWPRPEDVADLNPTADVAAYIASCSPEVILRLVAIARAAEALADAKKAWVDAGENDAYLAELSLAYDAAWDGLRATLKDPQ